MNIEQDMRLVCVEAARLGYQSVQGAQLLGKYGAIGAARRLMVLPDLRESELSRFFKLGRLDPRRWFCAIRSISTRVRWLPRSAG